MKKFALSAVLLLGILSPASAQMTNTTDRSMSTPVDRPDNTNHTDYGWLGLFGLLGLAGLKKRNKVDSTSYRANPAATR